ncbi:MAG: hypothetical protein ABW098_06410 [Candidatus Thiodiazotropha sp.]
MQIPGILLISVTLWVTAGCSSEQSGSEQAKQDDGVFQGYKETMDRAKGVEQTLMQADKTRREQMDSDD